MENTSRARMPIRWIRGFKVTADGEDKVDPSQVSDDTDSRITGRKEGTQSGGVNTICNILYPTINPDLTVRDDNIPS